MVTFLIAIGLFIAGHVTSLGSNHYPAPQDCVVQQGSDTNCAG